MSTQSPGTHLGPYKKWEKIFVVSVFAIGLIFVTYFCVGVFLFMNNDENWCVNDFPETYFSPDRKYKAISFLRNCGATEAYKPGVSLMLSDEEYNPNAEGNIFQCYRCACTEVIWISDRELLIEYCWPSGTGFQFESPDDFLSIQKDKLYDVDISLRLIQN
jgi:hypothetical protein